MSTIKDRNGMDLTEAEDIRKRWQEYTEELYKKDLHDGVITHLEPDILGCEVKWALRSITMNKASGGDGIPVAALAAAKSLQSCPTLCDPMDGSPPGSTVPVPPCKNTGVGCHFLLQCMKVKSESEVVQSCPTLGDPMDCSLLGSSVHGIFQARILEWDAIAFSEFQLSYFKS